METLAERITRDGPVNELDAIGWAIRLAKRLEALHVLGVAHGSVSPACILTTGQDRSARAYLADVQHTMATPAYQSPERILGGDISTADDAWALSATLYALLTGQSPFAGNGDAEVRQKILAAAPAPLAVFDVGDDDLQHILDRAFARDPSGRTSNVSALRRALEEWHPDRGVANLPPLEDEDSTNDDDVARTMMVRDASTYMTGVGIGVPKVNQDGDDEDDDNVRTVMRSMPQDDLASIIAKAQAASPPKGPHPGPGAPHGPPQPAHPGHLAPQPPPSQGGFRMPGAPPSHAGHGPPMARAPGFPAPSAPSASTPGGHGPVPPPVAPHRAAPPAPAYVARPPVAAAGAPAPAVTTPFPGAVAPMPAAAPPAAPLPSVASSDEDDEDDNARTVMRSADQVLASLVAAAPIFPPPQSTAGFAAPAAPAPAVPASPASWAGGPGADGPAPAATLALPAYDDAPPTEPRLGGGTQPMGGPGMGAVAAMAAMRAPPPAVGGGVGGLAAPGDLSALEGPPPGGQPGFGPPQGHGMAPPGMPMQPMDPGAGMMEPPPARASKVLLILAAIVALLIAAGVTFVILRSRAG